MDHNYLGLDALPEGVVQEQHEAFASQDRYVDFRDFLFDSRRFLTWTHASPDLELITMSPSSESDLPSVLGELTKLTIFDVSYNFLAGSIPSTYENLVNMEIMNLQSNVLSGSLPRLTVLQSFQVANPTPPDILF
jgi:hypothetical protein